VGSQWCNDECVLLECGRLWVLDGVMMSVFSSSVVDSSLHHPEPPIYHTRGEHTHHYTIENPQSTTLEENTLITTPSRTHNLPHSRRTHHSSLHYREPTIYQCVLLECSRLWVLNGVMMSVFSSSVVDCGFSMV
jgi:hypothetical protein